MKYFSPTAKLLCAPMLLFAAAQLRAETTMYVGKHFEVRDHDQPTKYVFNGDTRVARITGSLSTNTRIQRFRLRSGWNLLSLAVSATNLSQQLQRPGVIASAHSWNAQTGTYSPVPQVAASGMVLWVNVTTNTTLGVVGTYADPVHRQIAAGATYLASTGLEAWTPTLPPSVAAWSFDSQPPVRRSFSGGGSSFNFQPTWHARLTGDLSWINELPNTFPPGQVLYVINNAPFELEIPDPALRIRYYHQDHLGSSSVMTDASGALVEETAFYPFGEARNEYQIRQLEEPYKFTQKERDRESGLHYLARRYLTSRLSRFVAADPKYARPDGLSEEEHASFLSTPQQFNLYSYAQNNPLKYVDPTGLDAQDSTKVQNPPPRAGNDPQTCASEFQDFIDAGNVELCVSREIDAAAALMVCFDDDGTQRDHRLERDHGTERDPQRVRPQKYGAECLGDVSKAYLQGRNTVLCEQNTKTRMTQAAQSWLECLSLPAPTESPLKPPPSAGTPQPSPNPSPPLTKLYDPVTGKTVQWVPNLILVEP